MSSKTVIQNIIALFKIFPIMFSSKSPFVQHVISLTPAMPAVPTFSLAFGCIPQDNNRMLVRCV